MDVGIKKKVKGRYVTLASLSKQQTRQSSSLQRVRLGCYGKVKRLKNVPSLQRVRLGCNEGRVVVKTIYKKSVVYK